MADTDGLVQHLGYVDSLNVAISICLTYTLLVSCVRIYLRRGGFGYDDVVILIATLITLIHFATSYASLAAGLGKPYDMLGSSLGQISSTAIAGVVTFIMSLYAAKIAALVFLMRIKGKTQDLKFYRILIGLLVGFGVVSIFCVTVACPTASGYYWDLAGNCTSCPTEWIRWQVMTALDIVSEVILFALPLNLVWSLQMPTMRKMKVVGTFWMRLPTIALSIVRQTRMNRLRLASTDVSLASTLVLILMEVELTYGLISCTLSTSINFTTGFNTGWGMGHIRGTAESYNMSTIKGSSGRNTKVATGTTAITNMHGGAHTTSVTDKAHETVNRRFPDFELGDNQGLQLQPDQVQQAQTLIFSERTQWGETRSASSESDDLAVVQLTEYSISHDEAPILQESLDRL